MRSLPVFSTRHAFHSLRPVPAHVFRSRKRLRMRIKRSRVNGASNSSDSKWRVFESVHISTHIIYAVLTEKALNPLVECASGLLSGEDLSITLKFGRKRSIEHSQPLSQLPSYRPWRRPPISLPRAWCRTLFQAAYIDYIRKGRARIVANDNGRIGSSCRASSWK